MAKGLDERRARARRRLRLQRIGSWLIAVFGSLVLLVGLPLLVWQGPYLLDARYIDRDTVGDGSGSAPLVTGLRTALVALVASVGAGVALVYTARNYRLTRRGQVTDRFTKALERLGSDEQYVRIGGVLALEQIIQDAPEQATHAAQVLGHFVRARAPGRPVPPDVPEPDSMPPERERPPPVSESAEPDAAGPEPPDADVQVALTALTRPESRTHVDDREELRLTSLPLHGADLSGADLSGADLSGADLSSAGLGWADLSGADLTAATLSGASLGRARLTGTTLTWADLARTDLIEADLTGADLDANLAHASLDGANLTGASLFQANLTHATLSQANLTHATLDRANLTHAFLPGANLTHATLSGANLTGAHLGAALTSTLQTAPLDEADLTWMPEAALLHLGGADLTGTDLGGADLTGAHLDGADLTRALNLRPDQIQLAEITERTKLPPDIEAAVRPSTD